MKNFYSLNAGEFFVAQELSKQRRDLELYYPLKDKGVDLLAVKNNGTKSVRIQVKESRAYDGPSWHQIRDVKIKDADVFVFVTYVEAANNGRVEFDKDFVIIPRASLARLCSKKKPSNGKYSFYFEKLNGAGHASHFRRERAKLIHHRIDGVFELENFALYVDRDLLRQVTRRHGSRHVGDIAHLAGEITGHEVHAVRQVFPGAGHPFDHRLATELAVRAHLAAPRGSLPTRTNAAGPPSC